MAEFLVHRAVDGQSFAFPPGAVFETLDSLKRAVGELTCVEPSDVIPFFGNGEQLREDNVVSAGSAGWDELYIFSKETLQADAAEVIAALEIKKVPPAALSLSASSVSLTSASAALGETLETHVYPLIDSLHTQSRALILAASNLSLHLASLAGFHTSLGPLAAREFARQRELLASYRAALWIVERIVVDKRLFSGKTKDGERKLGDYVNLKKMAVVEEGCVKLEEELSEKWAKAESSIEELLQGEKQIRAVTESQTCDEADDCVAVVERAVERARELEQLAQGLAQEVSDETLRELADLERLVREKVELLTEIKNSFNAHVVHTLQSISHFQSFIPPMAATLNSLSATLRSPPGFSHLSRLYSLPLAYGRLLVESYRRLAFGASFLEQSGKVAEVMARWVTGERRRREKYEVEMKGLLPWDARTTDEVPGLEVSTVGGGVGEDGLVVSRVDVDDFLLFIESLERDPGYIELAAASASLDKPGLLVELRETLAKHLTQVEDAKVDFERLVEKNLLSKSQDSSGRRGSTIIDQTLVKTLSTEKDELSGAIASKEKIIRDLQAQLATAQEAIAESSRAHEATADGLRAEVADLQATAAALRTDKSNMDAQVAKLTGERTTSVRELAQAQIRAQDLDDALLRARASTKGVEGRLADLGAEMERRLREKGLESERALRDHISEADGDRAILEHQLVQANAEIERQREQADNDLKLARDKATREVDAIKADLKMAKVQSKSVEVRNKELVAQLEKVLADAATKEKESARLLADALRLARTLKESAEKLLDAIRSSSLASSLSLQSLSLAASEPSATSSTSSLDIPTSASAQGTRRELEAIARFDIRSFEEIVLKSFKLVKKWQQKATEYRDKAKDKIAIGHFSPGDLALFLPTRNYTAAVRPWAAFNVNFPHYFLKTSATLSEYLLTREYHLARIIDISEKTVAADGERDASGSDVGLPVGTTYFVLETEDFTPTSVRAKARRTASSTNPPLPPSEPPAISRKASTTATTSVPRRSSSILHPVTSSSLATSPIMDRSDVRQAFSPPATTAAGAATAGLNGTAASDYFSRTIAPPSTRMSASALSATQPFLSPSNRTTTPGASGPMQSPVADLTTSSGGPPMPTPGRTVVLPKSEEPGPSFSSPSSLPTYPSSLSARPRMVKTVLSSSPSPSPPTPLHYDSRMEPSPIGDQVTTAAGGDASGTFVTGTRSVAIPVPLPQQRTGRPASISSASSVPRPGSLLSLGGGPRSFTPMSGSHHLAKAPATTASSTEAFGDFPLPSSSGHATHTASSLSGSFMAQQPPSAAAAHLSKHSSSSDLGALSRATVNYNDPYSGSSPGRMSFMAAVAASGFGLGGGGGATKGRSASESESARAAIASGERD